MKKKKSAQPFGSYNTDDSDRPRWTKETKLENSYEYRKADDSYAFTIDKGRNPDGEKVFRTRRLNLIPFSDRFEPEDKVKEFYGLGDVKPVLYRLPELIAASPEEIVFICEGEKDVESLMRIGKVATTNPFGALKWRDEYSEYLVGRDIAILPDNDKRGQKHAERVLYSVYGKARSVRIVNLPDLPPKGDVTDWLEGRRARK